MKQVDLGFTEIEIYDCFAVIRTQEGADVSLANHIEMRDVVEREIDGSYGLIFDWINSYSVNPQVFEAMRANPRIACYAVVSYRESTTTSLAGAADTIGKPGTFCDTLGEAQHWVRNTMNTL